MKNQSLFAGLLLALVFLSAPGAARGQNPLAVLIIFDNQTGLDPSQIFIQFMGWDVVDGQYINTLSRNTAGLFKSPNTSLKLAV